MSLVLFFFFFYKKKKKKNYPWGICCDAAGGGWYIFFYFLFFKVLNLLIIDVAKNMTCLITQCNCIQMAFYKSHAILTYNNLIFVLQAFYRNDPI
jgi:hypothetical protein